MIKVSELLDKVLSQQESRIYAQVAAHSKFCNKFLKFFVSTGLECEYQHGFQYSTGAFHILEKGTYRIIRLS